MGLQDFWSDMFCRFYLEFEAMSHGGTERTEDYLTQISKFAI